MPLDEAGDRDPGLGCHPSRAAVCRHSKIALRAADWELTSRGKELALPSLWILLGTDRNDLKQLASNGEISDAEAKRANRSP